MNRAKDPFRFVTQMSLIGLTGLKARDLRELLQNLKSAPPSVIYFHTHHFLKQHQFLSPEPPNDFAYWVTNVLQEERLGEQLASIDTVRYSSIRALGARIIEVIEKHLEKNPSIRVAPEGEEFHVMRSQSFVFPANHVAWDLAEFVEAVKKVGINSLYHHIFEARIRLEKPSNDFSMWLETELGEKALARSIAAVDPYTQTLEDLRKNIIRLGETRIRQLEREPAHAA